MSKRGRPHRKRLILFAETEAALRESGIHADNDEAAWIATGHVFGSEVSPRLVNVLTNIRAIKTGYLQPRLTQEEIATATTHFTGLLKRSEDALKMAESVSDPNFTDSVQIILSALDDPVTGKATEEKWMEVHMIVSEARHLIAISGGTSRTQEDGYVQIGSAESSDVVKGVGRRWKYFDRDLVRNLLKRLKLRAK